jgi:hypothetical protein
MTPDIPKLALAGDQRLAAYSEPRQAWRAARDDATLAYLCWRDAPRDRKADAYAVYRAAADREDAAAGAWLGGVMAPGSPA